MVGTCKDALAAVRQVLPGTRLSLLEARPAAHSFHVLIEVHSLTQPPAQAAAAFALEVSFPFRPPRARKSVQSARSSPLKSGAGFMALAAGNRSSLEVLTRGRPMQKGSSRGLTAAYLLSPLDARAGGTK